MLDCAGKRLDLRQPKIMGILNVTPDSFSDGGNFRSLSAALERAQQMVEEGADIVDVGGESTRPGAGPVSEQEELERIIPVVEKLASDLPIPISVDTSKPGVMSAAVAAGAGLINDIRALRTPGAIETAAAAQVPVCLMHMQGENPATMQRSPTYSDVNQEVYRFLSERIQTCLNAGIKKNRILVDPGFGFGKNLQHNLALLKHLGRLSGLGVPLLVGISRKSMLGAILDKPVEQRLYGGLAASVLALAQGAKVLRTHDVGPTLDAVKIAIAVLGSEEQA